MVRQRFTINPLAKFGDNQDDNKIFSHLKIFATRLVKRKTITDLQTEANADNELKRTLSSFQLLALGVGSIIGKI